MYIEEPVYCLFNDYKSSKLKTILKNFNPIEKFITYCKVNKISTVDSLEKRDTIYEEILKSDSELYESFKNITAGKSITPYISFYTSLGSSQKIHIIRD